MIEKDNQKFEKSVEGGDKGRRGEGENREMLPLFNFKDYQIEFLNKMFKKCEFSPKFKKLSLNCFQFDGLEKFRVTESREFKSCEMPSSNFFLY